MVTTRSVPRPLSHGQAPHRVWRRSLSTCLLAAAFSPAWAAGSFGSGCSLNGTVIAEGGPVGAVASNSQSYAGTLCGSGSVNTQGTVQGSRWTGDYDFAYSFAQGALANSAGSAGLGVLHAYAHSVGDSTPKEYWYTANDGNSYAIRNEYLAYSKAAASAQWFDRLEVQQGSAPYGRVVLRYTLQLWGSTSVTPPEGGRAEIAARFIVDDDRNVSDRSLSISGPGRVSFEAGYYPGTSIKLFGDLSASTEVRAGGRVQNAWGLWVPGGYLSMAEAFANAGNTAGFQIEVLTPGASYITDSGQSYAAMVPEPSSTAMLGLGTLTLLMLARRRRLESGH